MACCHYKCCSRGKHAVRLTPNTTDTFSIFYVAGAWKGARKNEARDGDTLFVCLCRGPFFLAYYFQAPATQHKVSRGRAIYSELGDVCMQADT